MTKDICPERSGTIKCDSTQFTNFTPVVVEAIYGVSQVQSDLCEYKFVIIYSLKTYLFILNLFFNQFTSEKAIVMVNQHQITV